MMLFDIAKVFLPAAVTFSIGMALTPFVTHYLYKHRMWKKRAGKIGLDGKPTEVFNTLHLERETGTPRLGGIVVWGSVAIAVSCIAFLAFFTDIALFDELNFLSRGQTWIPLAVLLLGALVGLIDDLFEIRGEPAGGLSLRKRLIIVALAAFACAWWFYVKLEVSSIAIPFSDPLELGTFFIPVFVFIAIAIYSGGVIDGVDGLAGGVFASMFAAYAGIAFFQTQVDLAAFCAAVAGGILAFLWFNIPPARFYLSETGTMGLTLALTNVAFLTDTLGEGAGVALLPIIGIALVATVVSIMLQITWKKVFGKKLLRIAPLHHHFEAIGWPGYKVTMRYWVVSVVAAILGISLALLI
jgi:phospho-N-acetylmuramoyl-pentapeptide-transferase